MNRLKSDALPNPTLDEVMTDSLVGFCRNMMKETNRDKYDIRDWIMQRFDAGGSLNLKKYNTGMEWMADGSDHMEDFYFESGQVYDIDNLKLLAWMATIGLDNNEWSQSSSELGDYLMKHSIQTMAGYKSLIIWRIHKIFSTEGCDLVSVYGLLTNKKCSAVMGGDEGIKVLPHSVLGTVLASLLQEGVITYFGKGQ